MKKAPVCGAGGSRSTGSRRYPQPPWSLNASARAIISAAASAASTSTSASPPICRPPRCFSSSTYANPTLAGRNGSSSETLRHARHRHRRLARHDTQSEGCSIHFLPQLLLRARVSPFGHGHQPTVGAPHIPSVPACHCLASSAVHRCTTSHCWRRTRVILLSFAGRGQPSDLHLSDISAGSLRPRVLAHCWDDLPAHHIPWQVLSPRRGCLR